MKVLAPLKEYFSDSIKGIRIKKMPEFMKQDQQNFGAYFRWNKTIYLNDEYMNKFPNKRQQFIRTILHEFMHAKQDYLYKYAKKNLNNKSFTKEEKQDLKTYIESFKTSDEATQNFKEFMSKHQSEDLENNKELVLEYKKLYNEYNNAKKEEDADNVALAFQFNIGESNNSFLQRYSHALQNIERSEATARTKELADIRSFTRRTNELHKQYGRLSEKVNTSTWYQSAYHGSAKDFDKFDLNYALSGEGAMAHGYGVYTAKNKEVSEDYRKKLSEQSYIKNAKINGRNIERVPFFGYVYRIRKKM